MAVKTNITINIVEPGSDVPVPDTGLFTHGIGGTETTIIVSAALVTVLVILSIVLTTYMYRKHKKQGRTTKLVHLVDSTKAVITNKKRVTIGLTALALLASISTLTALLSSTNKNNTSAIEGEEGLTVNAESKELTIEVKDQPVFAVLPVQVTVEEATQAGYTLTAYTESTDLVSTTNPNNKIPMVTVEGDELTTLQDNTWGLALDNEPTAKDNKVYTALSTDQDNPTLITDKDYEETEAHYITNLSFDGNGSDGGKEIESRIIPAGDTITLPENTYTKEGYTFIGWNTVADPTEQDPGEPYADKAVYQAGAEFTDVTLYAQWKKNILYMQNVSEWGSSLEIGDEVIAVDSRDDKEYYVARLADNNIWMIQNLDLDLNNQIALTPENTNISANWTPANSTISFTGTTVDGWQISNSVPQSADPGELYVYSSSTTSDDTQYTSLADCQIEHPDCNAYNHVGNYYNWSAAVANNDTSEIITQYDNMDTSVCPAGWRLPDGPNEKNQYYNDMGNLIASYDNIVGNFHISCEGFCGEYDYLDGGFNIIRTNPLWLSQSGRVYYGSFVNIGSFDGYWSSVIKDESHAYSLNFDADSVLLQENFNRHAGFSVRCITH